MQGPNTKYGSLYINMGTYYTNMGRYLIYGFSYIYIFMNTDTEGKKETFWFHQMPPFSSWLTSNFCQFEISLAFHCIVLHCNNFSDTGYSAWRPIICARLNPPFFRRQNHRLFTRQVFLDQWCTTQYIPPLGSVHIQYKNFESILCSARQTLCRVGGFKVKLASAVLKIEKRLHAMLLS